MVSTYIDDLFHSVNGVFIIIILFYFLEKMCHPSTDTHYRINEYLQSSFAYESFNEVFITKNEC